MMRTSETSLQQTDGQTGRRMLGSAIDAIIDHEADVTGDSRVIYKRLRSGIKRPTT